jgi:UDP-glucose 4-epimerase
VKQAVIVGRHTYYGAAPEAALYHTEDEPPQALDFYPELADLAAADLFAVTALWRFPDLATAVLRICYTLGPSKQGTLAGYLRGRRVPTVLGYDPLFQFIHEEDAAAAIVLAARKKLRGIYNIAGPQPLPLSVLIRETGRVPVALPERVLRRLLGRFGFPKLPVGALSHLKFPIVIDASAFQAATGFRWRPDELAALHSLGPPAPKVSRA